MKEKTDKKTLELEYKQEGFGFYDDRNNKIIFLGGYNYRSHNEQKVNKFIYLIDENKDFRVKRLNKTTKSLFPIDKNFTSKNALFPLVYGLPLFVESKELNNSLLILSSNGFKEDINHSNRLFISTLNLTEDTANIGFSSLMRL